MAREAWTDERLDDLKASTDAGFGDTREEFRAVRGEMQAGFRAVRGEMQAGFQAVRGEIEGVREEIGAMRRSIDQLAFGLTGAMLVGFLTTTVAIVTQL